jgi:3-dehydroquinate dehydratase II
VRVLVLHGVNFDQLGRRDALVYGGGTLAQLEARIDGWAAEREIAASFFQTNHEGAYVEALHAADADALILNPGAWSHYAWAIRDALELCGLPAAEVHLSDITRREPWRRHSVISELCLVTITGRGPEGYRDALDALLRAA